MAENKTFPTSSAEALAILYLQNQDLSTQSPLEIADKYHEALKTIDARLKELNNTGKSQRVTY